MIEIQKIYVQKIHGLHELGSRMERNDTLHGSELGPHWVLGPKYSKFGPIGPKLFAQKFLYTKLVRYHEATLWSFEAKIVFWAKQIGNIQIPDFTLSVRPKNQNLVPWDQNFWLKNFFTQSYSGTMALFCTNIVLGSLTG